MKNARSIISIAMATIVLVSLCAVCASTGVGATQDSSRASVQASPDLVGASITGAPAVCSHDGYTLDLFARGTNGALYWKNYSWAWSAWMYLGGQLTADPAAVSQSAGMINVFVRGSDGALWAKYTTDGGVHWSAWSTLGGQLLAGTGPTACAWDPSRIDLFVIGTNHALYHTWIDRWGNRGWENLGGYLTSSPAATSMAPGVIDVFARGSNGALYQRSYKDGTGNNWGSWISRGGQLLAGTGPAASSFTGSDVFGSETSVDVFVTGMTASVYWNHWDGTKWSNWANGNLGGKLTSSPSATRAGASGYPYVSPDIYVFARGTTGLSYYTQYTGAGGKSWTAWTCSG